MSMSHFEYMVTNVWNDICHEEQEKHPENDRWFDLKMECLIEEYVDEQHKKIEKLKHENKILLDSIVLKNSSMKTFKSLCDLKDNILNLCSIKNMPKENYKKHIFKAVAKYKKSLKELE